MSPQTPQTQQQSKLQLIYDQAATKFDMPEFDQFPKIMSNPQNRRIMYDLLGQHFEMPEFEEFDLGVQRALSPLSSFQDEIDESGVGGIDKLLLNLGLDEVVRNRVAARELRRTTKIPFTSVLGGTTEVMPTSFQDLPFAKFVPAPKSAGEFLTQLGRTIVGDPVAEASLRNLITTPLVKPSKFVPARLSDDELDHQFAGTPLSSLPIEAKRGIQGFTKGTLEVAEGLTTPENLAILGSMAVSPSGVSNVLSLVFAKEMASALPEQVAAFAAAMKAGDVEGGGRALAHMAGTSAFATSAAIHGLGRTPKLSPKLEEVVNEIKQLPPPRFIPAEGKVKVSEQPVPKVQLALPEPPPAFRSPGNKSLADLINASVESIAQPKIKAGREVKALPEPSFTPTKGKVRIEAEQAVPVGSIAKDVPIEGSRGVDISLKDALREKYKDDVKAFERDFDALSRKRKSMLFDVAFNKGRGLEEAVSLVLSKSEPVEGVTRRAQRPPKVVPTKINNKDFIAHSVEGLDDVRSIAKEGLRPETSVEPALNRNFATGTFRLIFRKTKELGEEKKRAFAKDLPFNMTKSKERDIVKIEVDVENLPDPPRPSDIIDKEVGKLYDTLSKDINTRIKKVPFYGVDNEIIDLGKKISALAKSPYTEEVGLAMNSLIGKQEKLFFDQFPKATQKDFDVFNSLILEDRTKLSSQDNFDVRDAPDNIIDNYMKDLKPRIRRLYRLVDESTESAPDLHTGNYRDKVREALADTPFKDIPVEGVFVDENGRVIRREGLKSSVKENIFGGKPGISGISAKEAAAQAREIFDFPSRTPQPPPPVMRANIRDQVFGGAKGTGESVREALRSRYELDRKRFEEDIKAEKRGDNPCL